MLFIFVNPTDFYKLQAKICFGSHKTYINLNFLKCFKSQNLDSVETKSNMMDEGTQIAPPPQFKFMQKYPPLATLLPTLMPQY